MITSQNILPAFIQNRGTRFKALFALGMVCFFWGTTWIAAKEGVRHMPALQLVGIRQSLGGLIYVIFFIGKGRLLPRGKEWGPILMLGFLNFILSNGLSTWGVQYISAGLGSIIGATFPLWLVVIAFFRKKPAIPKPAIWGSILAFGGICVIFYEHLHEFARADFLFGISISFMASWSWAFGTMYTKDQAKSFNPYFSLGLQMVISGIVLSVISQTTGLAIPFRAIPFESWMAITYLVVFGSVISFIAYLYALQHLSTQQASIYAYINPVVAVILGVLIFQEKITLFIAIGGIISLYGVYIINQAFRSVTR
ncbi:MAG TPA: EamA family transporter [Flavitalea sp.]|nr:EamA family transporter [Flavitalea sp.]